MTLPDIGNCPSCGRSVSVFGPPQCKWCGWTPRGLWKKKLGEDGKATIALNIPKLPTPEK